MRIRHIALGVVATAVLACKSPTPAQTTAAGAAAGPSAPVARIGTEVITAGELDTSIRGELNEMEQRTYDLRKSALDQLINQRLVEAKARSPASRSTSSSAPSWRPRSASRPTRRRAPSTSAPRRPAR